MPVPLGVVDQGSLITILDQCEGGYGRHDCCRVQCASDGTDGTNGADDSSSAYDGGNGRVWLGRSQCNETLAPLIMIMISMVRIGSYDSYML